MAPILRYTDLRYYGVFGRPEFDVWVNHRPYIVWVDPIDKFRAHEKFDVWTGPNLVYDESIVWRAFKECCVRSDQDTAINRANYRIKYFNIFSGSTRNMIFTMFWENMVSIWKIVMVNPIRLNSKHVNWSTLPQIVRLRGQGANKWLWLIKEYIST